MQTRDGVILAADGLSLDQCRNLVFQVGEDVNAVKIHNLFDEHGPQVIGFLKQAGVRSVWVDVKLHDIPNTVFHRAKAISNAGANIITVHASGEVEMMKAAVEGFAGKVYAVTVLTSIDEERAHLLFGHPTKASVLYMARLAKMAGVTGIVCSPKEVEVLSRRPELQGLEFITPGIRSAGKDVGDQKRVDTPAAAFAAGATRIVVGRQITEAKDPAEALSQIAEEIAGI